MEYEVADSDVKCHGVVNEYMKLRKKLAGWTLYFIDGVCEDCGLDSGRSRSKNHFVQVSRSQYSMLSNIGS